MINRNRTKKILIVLLSILMVLTYLPTDLAHAVGSSIESFSTTYRAGGQNIAGKYTWVATNNNADHRFTFRINYAMSGQEDRPAKSVEIRIPSRLIKNRNGEYADYLDMSIPEENDPEITDDTKYVYYVDGDDVVIYNRIPVHAAENGYIEVSYITKYRTFEYTDMGASDDFTAVLTVNDEGNIETREHTSGPVYIDTGAEILSTEKRTPKLYKSWNDSWGTDVKPEDAGDYYYLVWEVRSRIKQTSQPYNFSLEDTFNQNADGSVVGYKMQGEKKYREDSQVEDVRMRYPQDSYEDRYDYVLTKHKKVTYADLEYYEMKNVVTACVDPIDQIDDDTFAQSNKNWIYKKPHFTIPSGHFKLWKWGNDYRDWYVSDSEDIRDFSLSDFKNDKTDEIPNLRYHVEEIGYPYPWTLDGPADDPDSYGKKPVTYKLSDENLKINENDTQLTGEDYEFEKLKFSCYIRDAEFNEEEQIFETKDPTYTDAHVIDFYAKKNGDYTKVAVYHFKNGSWSDLDNDYIKSASGTTIEFKAGVTGWKTEMTNAFYNTDFNVYPYVKLKKSQLVEQESTGKDKIWLTNTATNTMFDSADKQIYTETLSGTDYIIGVEMDGHIVKSVTGYKNNKAKKAYTISWSTNVYEDYMSPSFTRIKTTQDSGVFYDLLPIGGMINTDSIAVYSDSKKLSNSQFTYEIKENYKRSGRDLLIVKVKEPGKEYSLRYNTVHSWDSIKDLGINVRNDVAYETGNDEIGDGLADTGGGVDEFVNLDPDSDAEKFLYTKKTHIIDIITAGNLGLYKKVKAEEDEDYVRSTTTYPDSNYSYNIRFATDEETQAKNLIVFDSLENYHDQNVETEWHGQLKSVNTKQVEELGVEPVVYYSTFENLDLRQHHDLNEEISGVKVWKTEDEIGNIEAAKAVAIDLRKTPSGDNFVLDYDTGVSITLNMRSPHTSNAQQGHENAAYNNIYLQDTLVSAMGFETDEFIHQDYTKIKYRVMGNFEFEKVSSKDNNLKISGIKFRLSGTSDYGTEVNMESVSDSNGKVAFKKVEKGTYDLQEVSTTEDWLEDHEVREVVVDGEGNVTINGETNYKFENEPRIHTDIQFRKKSIKSGTLGLPNAPLDKSKNMNIPGVTFYLNGTSDYGNNVSSFATSNAFGLVEFDNIEKGTYILREVATNPDYILNVNTYTVQVDENGNMTIKNVMGNDMDFFLEKDQAYYIFNEPYHDFSLRKIDATNNTQFLSGAEFRLSGTSNYGTRVDETQTSNDMGRVTFSDLESGTYVLAETKAPKKHILDPTKRIVEIDREGNVTIEGLRAEQDTGFFIVENERSIEGKITVTKKWHDGLTGEAAENRPEPTVHISTSEPKEFNGYNVRFDANDGNFNNGDTINVLRTKPKTTPDQDVTKYAHTPNLNNAGEVIDSAGHGYLREKKVITIPNAESLHVKIKYGTYSSSYGTIYLFKGDYTGNVSSGSGNYGQIARLSGNYNNPQTVEYDIEGDTATIWFYSGSNSSSYVNKYGYSATITGHGDLVENEVVEGTYKEPAYDSANDRCFMGWAKKPKSSNYYEWGNEVINKDMTLYAQWEPSEAYAVFDSSDGTLRFFRDKPKKYTNGQADETKTYYTGFEAANCTSDSQVPWYSKRASITSVAFEDEIKPISTAYWFCGMNNLTSFDDISKFDTSNVTNMKYMFYNCNKLTSLDVSGFDTSKVTNMYAMFDNCSALTSLDVSGFDTSKVTNMGLMFYNCSALTSLDVSGFDTSKVTSMDSMFSGCNALTSLDVSGFDTSNVTDMRYMFDNCYALTNLDASSFDTSKVTNMDYMFSGCNKLTSLDVSGFDTSKVTSMNSMFYYCKALTSLDVSGFDTSKVTNMVQMFSGCTALTNLDVSGFDTSKVTNMGSMFNSCNALTNIYASERWNTDRVTSSRYMFSGCNNLPNFSSSYIDKTKAHYNEGGYMTYKPAPTMLMGLSTKRMIKQHSLKNIRLNSASDTATITFNAGDDGAFADGTKTNVITYNLVYAPIEKYSHTPNISDDGTQSGNYPNSAKLNDVVTIPGAAKLHVKITYGGESASYDWACVWEGSHSGYTASSNYSSSVSGKLGGGNHTNSSNTKEYDITGDTVTFGFRSDGGGVGDGYGYYAVVTGLNEDGSELEPTTKILGDVIEGEYKEPIPNDPEYRFKEWNHDITSLNEDTTVTAVYEEDVITKGTYDGVNWKIKADGTLVIGKAGETQTFTYRGSRGDTSWPWYNYRSQIKSARFDGTVKGNGSHASMFDNCYKLTSLDLSGFDTSNVTSMDNMFCNCNALTSLDLSGFDTSKVTNMIGMFMDCYALASLDVSSFDTSNVTDMSYMFEYCKALASLDVSSFDTSNVTSMDGMFYNCNALTSLDLSDFDTSNVTSMNHMFHSCNALTSLDLSEFDTSKVRSMYQMFDDCNKLTSLNVSGFDTSKVTNMWRMFNGCNALTSLDLSEFDTSKVTSMSQMFGSCRALTSLNVSGFDTSNVTDMSYMFCDCNALTSLDVSGFDTSKVTSMNYMFDGCNALTSLALGEKTKFKPATYGPSNWTRYAKLSGMRVYDQPVLSNLSDYDGTAPGWYKVNGTTAPNESEMAEEHISKQEDHADVEWVKVSDDTWTYTFNVYDDESTWYVYEEDYDGYFCDTTISDYKSTNNGEITINNAVRPEDLPPGPDSPQEPQGKLDVTKKLAGDTTEQDENREFAFDITLSGMEGTTILNDIIFKDGKATFYLKAGEHFKLDLPAGTEYSVEEKETSGFTSSVDDPDGTIEQDKTDTITFTNTKKPAPPTNGFKVKKQVKGNLGNLSEEFEFRITFSGLEANTEYSISDGITFKTTATGEGYASFKLKSGQTIEIANLPINSKYQVTEVGNRYTPAYEITNANGGLTTIAKNKDFNPEINKDLSTSIETVDENENITIQFNNTREFKPLTGKPTNLIIYFIIAGIALLLCIMARKKKTKLLD